MSIRISIFYILPVVLLIFIPSLFCQTNSIDSLISIYKSDEQNPTNIIKIGEAYAAEKRWDLAINYYEKLIRIDPNNSDYLYRLGGTQAAYSEVVSKFKVLPLINKAKRNLSDPVILYAHPINPIIDTSEKTITIITIPTADRLRRLINKIAIIMSRPAFTSN